MNESVLAVEQPATQYCSLDDRGGYVSEKCTPKNKDSSYSPAGFIKTQHTKYCDDHSVAKDLHGTIADTVDAVNSVSSM